jgi:hypothetical protein
LVERLIINHSELRERGFRALADALGWVNAVRFLRRRTLAASSSSLAWRVDLTVERMPPPAAAISW